MADPIMPTLIGEQPKPKPEPVHKVRYLTDMQTDGTLVDIEVHHNAPEL